MTSISSLIGKMPTLVDYLSGKASGSSGTASGGVSSLADYLGSTDNSNGSSDVVDISPQAQFLMSQASNGTSSQTSAAQDDASVKSGAVDFIAQFFANSGIDMDSLSDQAKGFLKGLDDLIGKVSNASRDNTFDDMTKNYVRGQRQSYTLQGDGERVTAVVQYKDGKPIGLAITDLQGTSATTANITLGMDDAGKASTIEISRIEKQYSTLGTLTGSTTADPLSVALYA